MHYCSFNAKLGDENIVVLDPLGRWLAEGGNALSNANFCGVLYHAWGDSPQVEESRKGKGMESGLLVRVFPTIDCPAPKSGYHPMPSLNLLSLIP